MSKRKFTRKGETPTKFRCVKQKCKWEGKAEEKETKKDGIWNVSICPNCGHDTFYGLL